MKTLITILGFIFSGLATAEEIHVAVASNFSKTMEKVAQQYHEKTGHKVLLSFGSTGKLFAQIKNGAPFDAFFSADVERPEQLVKEGLADSASEFIYAQGKLALFSLSMKLGTDPRAVLKAGGFKNLALANPETAPYGAAAVEVMRAWGVYDGLKPKLVFGESVAQTFHYISTGNAQLGFISVSQLVETENEVNKKGEFYIPPQHLYKPIYQKAVILKRTRRLVVKDFFTFFRSAPVRNVIENFGYSLWEKEFVERTFFEKKFPSTPPPKKL
ncbi:MAG: molybdate ABC transporter substrate-binding protein [Deltaproteobacteria bacterium]|nr:molybdate ABC transporter substrate-binding protein [Deltaproteobacteria bacterium]